MTTYEAHKEHIHVGCPTNVGNYQSWLHYWMKLFAYNKDLRKKIVMMITVTWHFLTEDSSMNWSSWLGSLHCGKGSHAWYCHMIPDLVLPTFTSDVNKPQKRRIESYMLPQFSAQKQVRSAFFREEIAFRQRGGKNIVIINMQNDSIIPICSYGRFGSHDRSHVTAGDVILNSPSQLV